MSELALADFRDRLGKDFAVESEGQALALRLAYTKELRGSPRAGGGFQLEFHGPAEPALEQGMFAMTEGGDRFDLFIVPIGRDDVRTRYDCTFF